MPGAKRRTTPDYDVTGFGERFGDLFQVGTVEPEMAQPVGLLKGLDTPCRHVVILADPGPYPAPTCASVLRPAIGAPGHPAHIPRASCASLVPL